MKIAIITDSSACISKEKALQEGLYVARMPLIINDENYIEETTITRDAFIQRMLEGATVQTSQPNVAYTHALFEEVLETHDHLIYLPISKHLSGTYDTANMLAQEFDGKVTIIDTQFVSWPLYWMAIKAKELANLNYDPQRIKEILETETYMYASLIPEDIQYLKRGGRIKPAAAAIANLLKIIPVLKVEDGEIDLVEKVRTHKKAISVGIEKALEGKAIDEYDWVILDGGISSEVFNHVVDVMREKVGDQLNVDFLYPIVLAHTGPGTIAIAAIKKIKELS